MIHITDVYCVLFRNNRIVIPDTLIVKFEDNEDFHEGTLTSGAFGFSSTSFRVDAVVELLP